MRLFFNPAQRPARGQGVMQLMEKADGNFGEADPREMRAVTEGDQTPDSGHCWLAQQ